MSFTFFAKSFAYSWKMSFVGQVLCQRIEIGPWALAIIGKPSAAAPVAAAVAPFRNLRRDAAGVACWLLIRISSLWNSNYEQGVAALRWCLRSATILPPSSEAPQGDLTMP